jgi:4-amino-4-deoxy-L-arabinose transferase-like glycosyltransferase
MSNLVIIPKRVGWNAVLLNRVLFGSGALLVLFFSTYHLFSSPETWMDEGLIIQSAVGLLHTGTVALPVAPGVYQPLGIITTGFPVTVPLAVVFGAFGESLEAARIVMLGFLLCLYLTLFLYVRRHIGGAAAVLGLFLIIFFGPMYGNGRNVLGEIPGLLFMILALLPLRAHESLTRRQALWTGVFAGLAVATKPIFILFIPALLLALLLRHRELNLKKVFWFGAAGVLLPVLVWLGFLFQHETLSHVLAVYANPHDLNVESALLANVKRFFTELQPLYFLAALTLWTASYGLRRLRRENIPLTEETLLFFSVLIACAYIRTAGYYRYFFLGEVFALLYLPHSLFYLVRGRARAFTYGALLVVSGLLLFQAYETSFRSWTAVHYSSTRTESLERYFATLSNEDSLFVYQAPEVMTFVGTRPVYQYVEITDSIHIGESYIPLIRTGDVMRIITPGDFFEKHERDLFSKYQLSEMVDNYAMLVRR